MKCVILAGGRGSRIAEESHLRPKPMIEIGGRPILWHIMKIYSHHGINDFIVCLGYKGYVIKEYFANYYLHHADLTVDIASNRLEYHNSKVEPWRVTLVDTGQDSMTGGRLRRVRDHLAGEDAFCMTYGDGLADVDVTAQLAFHRQHGLAGTMTVVKPPGRFGAVTLGGDQRITRFHEKPDGDGWINGGFFVFSPEVIEGIKGDATSLEGEPLHQLAATGRLAAWRHEGFWQPMDTLREHDLLESQWRSGQAGWRVWG